MDNLTITDDIGVQAPTAEAGMDRIVKVGDTVSSDCSGSEYLENDPLAFQWSFASKPVGSSTTLADSTSVDPDYTADVTDDYEIQLIVSDGNSDSSADTVTINVTDGTILASRTSGVAPLAVFFNAGFVSSPVTGSGNSFHDVEYAWETNKFLKTMPKRFKWIFTPKHGYWLNLIEGFFSRISKTFLRAIRVQSKVELIERIYKGIAEINEEPVIFCWKYQMDELVSRPKSLDMFSGNLSSYAIFRRC